MSYTIKGGTFAPRKPQLDYDGKNFLLYAPNGATARLKEEVQVTYDLSARVWRLPDLSLYANSALEVYPDLPLTPAAYERLTRSDPESFADNSAGISIQGPEIFAVWKELYTFQRESVIRLVTSPKRHQQVVLSPGLGKTIVSLEAARILKLKRVLIVCIKDLMRQWQDEEEKWFGERTLIRLHGEAPKGVAWFVANYDTVVGRLASTFLTGHWDLVILDESVLVKNRRTRRFKKLLDLRHHNVDRLWELSGSPATRYPDDLWAQMHLLYPQDFRSYWRFARRYCVVESNAWTPAVITDVRHDRDPKEDLKELQFVRNQKDVLKDLPEEIPVLVPVELGAAQRKAYSQMSAKFVAELESGEKVKASIVLSQLIRLQQITSNLINIGGEDVSAKADALVDMLEAGSVAYPALVWVNWVPGAEALYDRIARLDGWMRGAGTDTRKPEAMRRVAWIHGATSKKEETRNELTFLDYKAGKLDLLILAMPVGKFGHNLQNTRTVVYYDKTWSADDFVQSMKRVKRIGLDHSPVVITLKAVNTTDEMIEENLAGKLPSISSISNDDLASILRSLTGEAA